MNITTVPVIVSGFSGSGAVFEYLIGRKDVYDPFYGSEFRLIHDPDGFMELYNSCINNYTMQGTSDFINRFIYKLNLLKITSSFWKEKKNQEIINSLIDGIISTEYDASPYCHRIKLKWIFRKYFRQYHKYLLKFSKVKGLVKIRIPVDIENIEKLFRKFLSDTIYVNRDYNCFALNHGASFWNPISTSKFYKNPLPIIVTRDVRDIYADISRFGFAYPGNDVDRFCTWYIQINKYINQHEWKNRKLMILRFEDFVFENKYYINKIAGYLNICENEQSNYKSEFSKMNIGIYKNIITKYEIDKIESKLKKYCYL